MSPRLAPFFFAAGLLVLASDAPAGPTDPAPAATSEGPFPLVGADFPEAKSGPPKVLDWASAPTLTLTSVGPAASSCVAQRVREWMRLRCPVQMFAWSLLAGSNEGLAFWIGGSEAEPFGEVLMPLRRGGKLVVQAWAPGKDASGGFLPKPLFAVQAYWLTGAASPVVVVR